LSRAAVPTQPASRSTAAAVGALPSRLIATFSGPVGLAVKIALLSIVNALAVWSLTTLASRDKWVPFIVLALSTLAIDWIYFMRRAVPLKFLIPGTIFLLGFQVIPVLYTVEVAFTNYSTGHVLAKSEAVTGIQGAALTQPANGRTYTMAPARSADGKLVLILADDEGGKTYVGTKDGLEPIPGSAVRRDAEGGIIAAEGYRLLKGSELFGLDKQITALTIPTSGQKAIRAEGLDTAVELEPVLRYDAAHDQFVRIKDGVVFRDNGRGSFVSAAGQELEPGWKTGVGLRNFSRMIHNPLVSKPFLRVFVWTFVFASVVVLLSFSLGLFLAITLDKKGMALQRLYRSLLVIPYAVPGFLSLLVWQGLLNDDFGVVNRGILHAHIPWLFDPNWAKVSVILVSLWLTFPYFFLVSLGALQSIPSELTEAAKVDGAGAWQLFRKVTLPLLLIAVAPLMIASFAFNFNNFNNIYLLTGGGPATDQPIAGSTDILISYTWKLAFAAGKGADYGLASAVAIVIFFIVAGISTIGFARTRVLENVA
jgi:arabinogalactan oligomer/maltooligosaccharide transport system permease protein